MGVFDRLNNIVKGKLSNSLAALEKNNPEAVFEAAIEERKKTFHEMKQAAAGIVLLRNKAQEKLERSERDLRQLGPAIRAAAEEGDDDTAPLVNNEFEIYAQQFVPEPGGSLMLGAGALALRLLARRRSRGNEGRNARTPPTP